MSRTYVLILLLAALGLVIVGTPGAESAYDRMLPVFERDIEARTYHIDPAELLGLMHNNRISLVVLDVRDEADFNLFHLRDSARMTPLPTTPADVPALPPLAVSVVVSNDVKRAEEAWMRLRALRVENVYVLAGGINGWLDIYRPGHAREGGRKGDETLRHRFQGALGARVPAAAPDPKTAPKREFEEKVKAVKPAASDGGGCG